jgi:hypothetical protein
LLGSVRGKETVEAVRELFTAAELLGYKPIAGVDKRYFFHKNPAAIYATFKTADWKRLGVYFKRPGVPRAQIVVDKQFDKVFAPEDNDGTIFIGNAINEPMQGTYLGKSSTGVPTMAKGIVRPQLINPATGEREECSYAGTGSFGAPLRGTTGTFYCIGELSPQQARLGLQAVMFNFAYPEKLIMRDSANLAATSALSMMSRDDQRRYHAAVPISMLLEPMATWARLGQIRVDGIRNVVYGSVLVPNDDEDEVPSFMLLPTSAMALLAQIKRHFPKKKKLSVKKMVGMIFVMHRDPALPDASGAFYARFAGVLNWDIECPNQTGIVIHPANKRWKDAGGDMDGDTGLVFYLPEGRDFALASALPRASLRTAGAKYKSTIPAEQMLEAAGDPTTSLLGPLVTGTMCLLERGAASASLRSRLATAIQGSVEAKKHIVLDAQVQRIYEELTALVNMLNNSGERPFMIRGLNAISNSSGLADKVEAWRELVEIAKMTLERRMVMPIEKAIAHRIMAFDSIFRETDFLRSQTKTSFPAAMRNAAKAVTTEAAATAVTALTTEYIDAIRAQNETAGYEPYETTSAVEYTPAATIRRLHNQLELACHTGIIREVRVTPEEAQIALLAYGPIRQVVKMIPPEIFERFQQSLSTILVNLIGEWESGTYEIKDLTPVPGSVNELRLLGDNLRVPVKVTVLTKRERNGHITSTRAAVEVMNTATVHTI